MKIHDLIQGSPEWRAHRADHWNASDAPAMMGESPYKTRSQFLRERFTGIEEASTPEKERIFAAGHAAEAQARPLAEIITGKTLYPVTGSEGPYSASFDGIDMAEEEPFEHKSLNDALRACMPVNDGVTVPEDVSLPRIYRIQMEQQLMVSGGNRVLFMASKWNGDTLIEERHCWYYPDPKLRAEIVAGWAQFEADLAAYEPPAPAGAVVVAAAVTALPAVSVQVSGSIVVRDNFKSFETALRDFIDNRLIREPATDQDFADLDLQIKALKNAEAALDAAEAQMLSQVEAVDAAKRAKEMLLKLARDNRLMAEKLLAARKESIKGEIVAGAIAAFAAHVQSMACPYLPRIAADFAGAAKNKRTVASLQDAVDTELARVKIEANGHYQRIQQNLQKLEQYKDHQALFADVAALVLKAPEDLLLVIRTRIDDDLRRKEKLLEAERERIRAEQQARADREAAAKVQAELAAQRQAEADALAEQRRAETVVIAAPAAPGGILDRGESPAGKALVNAMAPPPAPRADEPATLNLGAISERLGVTISAAFIASLGLDGAPGPRGSKLFTESQFDSLCLRLVDHVQKVQKAVRATLFVAA